MICPSAISGASMFASGGKKNISSEVARFLRTLTETERIVVIVRDELYSGSWSNMRTDLEARTEGRPYVFKLTSRIQEDLAAIEKLEAFELAHEINLSDYLEDN